MSIIEIKNRVSFDLLLIPQLLADGISGMEVTSFFTCFLVDYQVIRLNYHKLGTIIFSVISQGHYLQNRGSDY